MSLMATQLIPIEDYKFQFISALSKMDKSACVDLWNELLTSGQYGIPTLYEEILVPSLNDIANHEHPQTIPVWEEHLRAAIVRTVLELTYPHVLSQKNKIEHPTAPLKALILCLSEEYHELGALMASNYLELLNFDVFFIGANTPNKEILDAVKELAPDMIVFSITNYYHLFKTQDLITAVKAILRKRPTVVLGGYAIDHTPEAHRLVTPDFFARNFQDYVKIREALL